MFALERVTAFWNNNFQNFFFPSFVRSFVRRERERERERNVEAALKIVKELKIYSLLGFDVLSWLLTGITLGEVKGSPRQVAIDLQQIRFFSNFSKCSFTTVKRRLQQIPSVVWTGLNEYESLSMAFGRPLSIYFCPLKTVLKNYNKLMWISSN